jgi:Lar family restriction alleviation protein
MSAPELKPCPFCGGEASASGTITYTKCHKAWRNDGTQILNAHYVNCPRCGIDNKQVFGHQTQAKAIAAWNRRAPDPALIAEAVAREREAIAALPWHLITDADIAAAIRGMGRTKPHPQ